MRVTKRFTIAAAAVAVLSLGDVPDVQAQSADKPQASENIGSTDMSAQSRTNRPRVRIYRNDDPRGVYPRYNPGPNAVRDCTANLVPEYRPSGTVIVPRMNCYWRRG